jgi:protocatechuate 3,4-dioxygenase, alpha subunit
MTESPTPSQTVGPFFSIGLDWFDGRYVVPEGTAGAFWIRGRVLDGAGEPIPDALVETFQAGPSGRFAVSSDRSGASPPAAFRGFGRSPTNAAGMFEVYTVKPGTVPDATGRPQSPHIAVAVFARGLIEHVFTRIYFADENNDGDPLLASIAEDRRRTLVASPDDGGYRFDVRLQGVHETVFLAI